MSPWFRRRRQAPPEQEPREAPDAVEPPEALDSPEPQESQEPPEPEPAEEEERDISPARLDAALQRLRDETPPAPES